MMMSNISMNHLGTLCFLNNSSISFLFLLLALSSPFHLSIPSLLSLFFPIPSHFSHFSLHSKFVLEAESQEDREAWDEVWEVVRTSSVVLTYSSPSPDAGSGTKAVTGMVYYFSLLLLPLPSHFFLTRGHFPTSQTLKELI